MSSIHKHGRSEKVTIDSKHLSFKKGVPVFGSTEPPMPDDGKKELEALKRCWPALSQRLDELVVDPRLADVYLGGFSTYLISYGGKFRFQSLLRFWKTGYLRVPCPKCKTEDPNFLVYHIGGSMLSGCNQFDGFCEKCGCSAHREGYDLRRTTRTWIDDIGAAQQVCQCKAFFKEEELKGVKSVACLPERFSL